MSAGVTDGRNLTVETLEFVNANWATTANALDVSWDKPVLRDGVEKATYPADETAAYSTALRQNDVVTVGDTTRTDAPTGTEFDFDVTMELDVEVEAAPANGFSNISTSTDWQKFVLIVRRAILRERHRPITDPECIYDWRWLSFDSGNPLPGTEDSRDVFGRSITLSWHGYESLPSI